MKRYEDIRFSPETIKKSQERRKTTTARRARKLTAIGLLVAAIMVMFMTMIFAKAETQQLRETEKMAYAQVEVDR